MMNILLLNIDSKLPNIALHKLSMWHKLNGDIVTWDMPIMLDIVDKAYASCIFKKNRNKCDNYRGLRPDISIGGTGYDLSIKLPEEIDLLNPKINYGFTTRGCIRNCPFCLVRLSEGYIRIVGDLYSIWDGISRFVTFFDNNVLAVPEHFEKICSQCNKENVTADWNQGLDIRLVDSRICELLFSSKIYCKRFAFDNINLEGIVREKVALLRNGHPNTAIFFYVLVGYDTTFEEDLHRLNVLRDLNCRAYVMRHENTPNEKRYIRLAQWVNQFWTFSNYKFEGFCYEYELSQKNKSIPTMTREV